LTGQNEPLTDANAGQGPSFVRGGVRPGAVLRD